MIASISNIYQSLQNTAEQRPNAKALHFEGQTWTYQQFFSRVNKTMFWLKESAGLKKGNKLILGWGNTPEFCEVFYAAVGLGLIVIPLSTKLKELEGRSLIERIDADAVFWDRSYQPWLSQYQGKGIELSEWKNQSVKIEATFDNTETASDDPAVIMFTSGTTGTPKGAVITHGNIISAILAYENTLKLTSKDRTILAVPIYHITGLSAILALFFHIGGCVYLHRKFNAKDIIRSVSEDAITFLHGSPTVFILLSKEVKEQSVAPASLNSLRSIACGAGHLNEGTVKELSAIFHSAEIHPIYGLTETSSPATVCREDMRFSSKKKSSGQPIPGLIVSIRNDEGNELPVGQTGNIWLKGDVVVKKYWPDSAANETDFHDGYFFTRDVGHVDQDGYLYIEDRIKDMINRGGEKIYSIKLENIISAYQGVSEVAVIPVASHIYGEEPVAYIVPDRDSSLTSKAILDWLKERVAKFEMPIKIIFTKKLPRTWNGKISKRELRDLYKTSHE
ncbi:class I adenylate-forming enzyme family protein [Raoultella ornithinolytica]|uniref:class I adenylate-forming enzyme family protein n=1 Tax=Raoultella ornithinolytica TaxID=54291 RepID=UPI0011578F5E|nr:class I adenylate-forming enzyme family protein [Raoultella ornithinolytica]